MLSLLASSDPIEHILPHVLYGTGKTYSLFGQQYHVNITNQMVMAVVAAGLMVLIFPVLFRTARTDAPHGTRNFFEAILSFLREEVFRPALKDKTDRFVPFLWTLFFFILFCNLLGQIPLTDIFALITHGRQAHIGGTATGNINATGGLAVCAFFMIHISGVAQVLRDLVGGTYGHHAHAPLSHGHGQPVSIGDPHLAPEELHPGRGMNAVLALPLAPLLYLWNFAPHPFKPEHGQSPILWALDVPMWLILLGLELLGGVIKPFALMIRLFANMIAGHLVLAVLIGFIAAMPTLLGQVGVACLDIPLVLLIRLLELFVAFLQAYIFTFLTTLFIAAAVAPEH